LNAFGANMGSRSGKPAGLSVSPRETQRYTTIVRADEDALTQAIIA